MPSPPLPNIYSTYTSSFSEYKDHAEALRRQMLEVKAREDEATQLKIEQARIEQEQLDLHNAVSLSLSIQLNVYIHYNYTSNYSCL